MTMRLPMPVGKDGPITGRVRAELIVDEPGIQSLPFSGNAYTRSYPAASLDLTQATLTYCEYERDARQVLTAWQFAALDHLPVCAGRISAGLDLRTHLYRHRAARVRIGLCCGARSGPLFVLWRARRRWRVQSALPGCFLYTHLLETHFGA
ncbi:MAG: hypothetical protein ETSY2_01910 [Candidatus Entotheonella gemina]|uniref:Uncharacterized protein n=2 Tax=Candidatus Entotheonella TaxID=93171 RepID=W4MH47_9BACT|nr:MAG: hypothetical protein ETSY2_01910 [Candidatus Entotheonella gemina]